MGCVRLCAAWHGTVVYYGILWCQKRTRGPGPGVKGHGVECRSHERIRYSGLGLGLSASLALQHARAGHESAEVRLS